MAIEYFKYTKSSTSRKYAVHYPVSTFGGVHLKKYKKEGIPLNYEKNPVPITYKLMLNLFWSKFRQGTKLTQSTY
ncbi:hypothetical protein MAR_002446 [Mya arenaria]|uniref:Uncharacterized protein n=1 Tax=Mya arenaria TaxID=6604 RepID=A0ABY7FFN2_MYAAR|nr:hypothetical protein MAR_002240 [Mya arenaria]WAR20608.1 hypothetical protein MAR_002446 [Mya arenaria]